MRFHASYFGEYPWLDGGALAGELAYQKWRSSEEDTIIWKPKGKGTPYGRLTKERPMVEMRLVMKALSGAPIWSKDEMKLLRSALEATGFTKVGKRNPKKEFGTCV